ncbi:hypothetical protein BCR34DRAFT_664958 [Clohesyomyces aquaticus]|uniref:NmrA-like domain-containing protein n=1 Tax=Clohesyomyces aquaticus TaxID=1231657 RepID=A0A1Y1ZJU4_9PLEO|nr:hypothetical protein BCR34DRAFT_664958 [Clohesyomyces aquaticus]
MREHAGSTREARVYEPWFKMMHGERSGLDRALQDPLDKNIKAIAVTGATRSQGGGLVHITKKTPGSRVRAITSNPESNTAKKLASEGIKVIQASFNNKDSLVKAFDGVQSVFVVTNRWEHLFQGKSQAESGEIEEEQGMNIPQAASSTHTLEHYIWSTTPSAKRMFRGKIITPHMDYKANINARIKSELPLLAAIISYLYFGYYPQNMAFFPFIKPIERVFATGSLAYGKYANVALKKWTFEQMIIEWSEITGKRGVFMETTINAWTTLWRPPGNELSPQFKFVEVCDPWEENDEFISPEELGINRSEVVGFRGNIGS